MNKSIVIVDPASSGARLAPLLSSLGYRTIALFSPSAFIDGTLRARDYDVVLHDLPSIEAAVVALQDREVQAVIPGFETAIGWCDRLAAALNRAGNNPHTSDFRRNKFAMGERLNAVGVPSAWQIIADDSDKLAHALEYYPSDKVVLKPLDSSGSDGVIICDSTVEARVAAERLLGSSSKLSGRIERILAQQYLEGQQYLVNTVSWNGVHKLAEIWKFDTLRCAGVPMYDKQELVPSDGPIQNSLFSYTLQVLDALGLHFGIGHTELIMTARGPLLLETAARLPGRIAPRTMNRALGANLLDICTRLYSEGEDYFDSLPEQYVKLTNVRIAALRAPFDGRLGALGAISRLTSLSTFSECIGIALDPGALVSRTVDIFTCPGLVYFVSDDDGALTADMAALREIEMSGLFVK